MTIDLKKILLIVFDELENFNSEATQLRLGKDLYFDAIPIQNRVEFDEFFKNRLKSEQEFLLLCHVFHANEKKGYFRLINSKIEEDYGLQAVLVSSGDSGDVMKNLFDKEKDTRSVYLYTTLRESLKAGRIKPYTKGGLSKKQITGNEAKKRGIFISHSSKDANIVNSFRDIVLQGGLEYDLGKIKFTSQEDYGIPAGVNIPHDLKNFLINEMGLFIQFVSSNYSESRVCLNEEGAAWCLLDEKMLIPIAISEFKSVDLSWINTLSKAIMIRNKDSLMNIYQNRKDFFGDQVDVTRFSKKIDEFISTI